MDLRPHHLLCIQKFTGHGYDEKFTKHMTHLVSILPQGMSITLHSGCDDLCVACPFNKNGKCQSFEKVKRLDEKVLQACNYTYEQEGDWKDFAKKAKSEIIETEIFAQICGECQWYELCEKTKEVAWIRQAQLQKEQQ